MAGLTKNQLAEIVRELREQYKELAGRYSSLQDEHIKLQMDYMQALGKKLDRLGGRVGKNYSSLLKTKETLFCASEVNGEKGGASYGI